MSIDRSRLALALAAALLAACPGSDPAATGDAGPALPDAAGPGLDAATPSDASRSADAAVPDAGPVGCEGNEAFEIGAGIWDVTGPAAELGMMGYSQVGQKTAGIHLRLWSRAFVIASPCNGERVVFVATDLGMVFQAVQQQLVERLRRTFGDLYTERNLFLSANHTHSGPGGASHYTTYDLSILGVNQQNLDAIAEGIYQSIVRAHLNLAPGRILVAEGELVGAGINRSPASYEMNPAEERARYASNTDTTMTVLKLQGLDGAEIGLIDWFGVHGTSMGNQNRLISSDNKGYASLKFEREKGADYLQPKSFVAAFAQASSGDCTPNIYGGTEGGGADDFESTALAGEKQLAKGRELYAAAAEPLVGPVEHRHTFVKMDEVAVSAEASDGTAHTTCPAAFGLSAIAGAEDGPGFGVQGQTCEEAALIVSALTCTPENTECQAEKPIALKVGEMTPYPWVPEVLPYQVLRLGTLAVVGLPHEVTTMASRRLRQTVLEKLGPAGVTRVIVVGAVNAYASYLTTREEYSLQRYEGASTLFGPWQLAAVQQIVGGLAQALAQGEPVEPGPTPRDLRDEVTTFQIGVLYDAAPIGSDFGEVKTDAEASYHPGDTATVQFWGAHPANDLRTMDTYLTVERKVDESWEIVARDWDWETRFHWARNACLPSLACSEITIEWLIPAGTAAGTYRIRHFGDWKAAANGQIRGYEGTTREFRVE